MILDPDGLIFTNKERWSKAQEGELRFWTNNWAPGHYHWLGNMHSAIRKWDWSRSYSSYRSENRDLTFLEFFGSNVEAHQEFCKSITEKKCVEVGPACEGQVPFWWWVRDRVMIEPLAVQLREALSPPWMFQGDWRACGGEEDQPDLEGKVDGCLVCRNMLDHCLCPDKVLDNILRWPIKGCVLMLWTELGHAISDPGHFDWDANPDLLRARIEKAGFRIDRSIRAIHGPGHVEGIEFGCRATKIY